MDFLKSYLFGILILLISNVCFAQTIVISPHTVISHSKTYDNVTLDMSNGSFIIRDNATLTIKNSLVNGTISKANPLLINIEKGFVNMSNNQVIIKSVDIIEHPLTQSLHYFLLLGMGSLNITDNSFEVDKPFTVGLIITTATIPTTGIRIVNNKVKRFHGVFYILGTDNALLQNNILIKNTYGNLVVMGSNSKILGNTVAFAGNNRLGNSIDVIDSNNILVDKNIILTPTCHGIYVFNSRDVLVNKNRVYGGITYGMDILSFPETISKNKNDSYIKPLLKNHRLKNDMSMNITVTNNFFSQNRYGIAVNDVDRLTVQNNMFIQRFKDAAARKFWTNNDVLLQNVTDLTWVDNRYKEAYTQEEGGDNSKSNNIVVFPVTGGVVL